jgi:outer membrane receptor protein involved in Fe transport
MWSRVVLCLMAVVCSAGAYAQAVAGFGEVSGVVREPAGDGLPDTTVVLSNQRLGIQRNMTTTDWGVFTAPALTPGPGYSLEVSRKGFTTWTSQEFEVVLGQTVNFKITVQSETAASPADTSPANTSRNERTPSPFDESKFEMSTVTTPQEVDSLPASERRIDALAPLAPGVDTSAKPGELVFRGERFPNTSLTDGVLTTSTYYFHPPILPATLPREAITEMQTISATPGAEFGWAMGGFVNTATKSGTGQLHGALYDYFNAHSWNASDRYASGFRPTGSQNQIGANAGGPIRPEKLFWFGSFEDVNSHSQALNRIANPLIVNPIDSAVAPSNCTATAAQCAAAINFLKPQINAVVPQSLASVSGLGKVDYRLNDDNSITAEAYAGHTRAPNGSQSEQVSGNGGLLGYNGTYSDENRFAKADWTSALGGQTVNEFRGVWFKDRFSDSANASLLPSTGQLGISIAGTPVGGNPAYPGTISEQRYQWIDQMSMNGGPNQLKFGFEYSKSEDWINQIGNRYGSYDFPSLTAFAQDFSGNSALKKDYTGFTQTLGTNSILDFHAPVLSAYVQDTLKIYPRFTLTVGLRFDKTSMPTPSAPNPTYFQTASIPGTNKDFAPRVGAAYQLDNRTVIRAGYGWYFEPFAGELLGALLNGNSLTQTGISINPYQAGSPIFPRTLASAAIPTGAISVVYAANKFRNPFTKQATGSIERQVGRGTTVSLNYLYSRGAELWTVTDQNLNPSTVSKTYVIDNAQGAQVGSFAVPMITSKGNPAFGRAYEVDNGGDSWYTGLSAEVRKQVSRGITLHASYTWSHALDDTSGSPALAFVPASTYLGDYRSDKGNSSFDRRHRVTADWTWQPTAKAGSRWEKALLNNWQISGIATLGSSLHQTPIVEVNGQQFAGITMVYPNSLDGSGGWNRVPFLPVNSLSLGPQYVVNARLARVIPFRERVKGTLMVEAFNLFNTQYNTAVDTIAYSAIPTLPPGFLNGPVSGVLKPVTATGTGIESNGYPFGTNARSLQMAFRITF